jgi:acyl-CoA hydrolase
MGTNFESRVAEISNRFAVLAGEIGLAPPMHRDALIAELKKWHELQLNNLVTDARLDEAKRITARITAIFESRPAS